MKPTAAIFALLALLATALTLGAVRGAEAAAQAVDCSTDNYWDAGQAEQAWVWQDCNYGTTITVTNQTWTCNQPLTNYGTLPIRVIQTWTVASPIGTNGIDLLTNCNGPAGSTAVNLIIDQRTTGDGRVSDAVKTRMNPGPQNLVVTGNFETGPVVPQDHQDCFQVQGGRNSVFVNVNGCGDYDAGTTETQGAGGDVFYSLNNPGVSILGGKWTACNHGLARDPAGQGNVQPGTVVRNVRFRTGMETPYCQQFAEGITCDVGGIPNLVVENVSCQREENGEWVEYGSWAGPTQPPPPYSPACAPTCDQQIATLTAERDAALAAAASLQAQVNTLQSQVDTLQAQVSTLQAENAALSSANAALQAQVADLQASIAPLQAQIADLQAQVANLQAGNAALQAQVADLQAQIDAKDAQIEALNAKIAAAIAVLEG